MELWQLDVMGRVRLTDGTELSAVTGLDDHSRYCVIAQLVRRATARPVCQALQAALERYGLPEAILTDIQTRWRLWVLGRAAERGQDLGDRRPPAAVV
jgi:transposase InsO family protein